MAMSKISGNALFGQKNMRDPRTREELFYKMIYDTVNHDGLIMTLEVVAFEAMTFDFVTL